MLLKTKVVRFLTTEIVTLSLSLCLTTSTPVNALECVMYKHNNLYLEGKHLEKKMEEQQDKHNKEMLVILGEGLHNEQEKQKEAEISAKIPQFNRNDVTAPSNLTTEQITTLLQGTNLVGASNAYYWAEQTYNINAFFLIAITAEESSWGNSSMAHNLNNIGGIKKNGHYHYFNDFGECINEIASSIRSLYLTPGAPYHCPQPTVYAINNEYCPESDCAGNKWGTNVITVANELLAKVS